MKRYLCLVLVGVLLLTMGISSVFAHGGEPGIIEGYSKITEELQEKLDGMEEDERLQV